MEKTIAAMGSLLGALPEDDDAFGGAIWFDGLTQAVVSTGSTMAGEVKNSGFDDGITGNALLSEGRNSRSIWDYGGTDDA